MDLLEKFNDQEKNFIIQLGVLNFSKSKKFLKQTTNTNLLNILDEDLVSEYEKKIAKEKQHVEDVYEKLLEERNNFSKMLLSSTAELNEENKKIRADYVRLSESIMKEVNDATETRTRALDVINSGLKQEIVIKNKKIEEYRENRVLPRRD